MGSQVIDECVKAIEAKFSEKGRPDPSGGYVSGEAWEAYFTGGHRAIAAVCKLKVKT